ncbi:MAG TPA: hypothetical protein VFG69_08660 [Nannocystaceae bacterium]|nr:hypothetical protein [Nannocystaceae bacterium]
MARTYLWGSVLGLAIGCGPGEGVGEEGGETETETESGTGETTDGADDDGNVSLPTVSDTASASATATMTDGSQSAGSESDDAADTTAGDTADTGDDDATAGSEDGSCPPGGTGCPCDIGSTCEGELECVDGVCVEPAQCDQPEGEPNDDEASAVVLAAAACGDPAQQVDAALFGADTDWYIFELMGGQPFCFTNATAEVSMQDVDVEVCIFAVCPEGGQPNADCGFGSGQDEAESPDGHVGCCDTGSAFLDGAVCDFAQTPPMSVEVSVTADTGRECVPYQLDWHF